MLVEYCTIQCTQGVTSLNFKSFQQKRTSCFHQVPTVKYYQKRSQNLAQLIFEATCVFIFISVLVGIPNCVYFILSFSHISFCYYSTMYNCIGTGCSISKRVLKN
uniref:Uncharacterized protein n=1 Tax=Cacopsylla melanoneura TaxID=428564 RepID=A0A8D8QM44_9HEMI